MAVGAIPVIDLAPWRSGDAAGRREVAERVARACETVGFLIVSGHGVPQEVIDRAFSVSRAFFDLPVEEKARFMPEDGVAPRGYHAVATRNLARTYGQETPPDLREQFFIGPLVPQAGRFAHIPEAALYYSENIWPAHPPAYREALTEFYRAFEVLAARLMRVFAVALALPETFFDDRIDRHFSTCPSNHYPVIEDDPQPGQLRCGAHTDFGSLTILAFNDAPGGLQALMPDGSWLDVQPGPGQLAVNLGDMMQRWTNDRWKSTVHRAVNPPPDRRRESRRQTVGYFLHPNYDAEIACLDSCCGEGSPAKYGPIMAGDHMREKMERRIDG